MRHLTDPAMVKFLVHDTTTPVPVYIDAAKTMPHTHPVMADVDYIFPKIYLGEEASDVDMIAMNSKGDALYIVRLINVQGRAPNLKTRC